MKPAFDPRSMFGTSFDRRTHLCKEGSQLKKAALLFLPYLKANGKIPIPDACWPCFKWLPVNITINKKIKMDKIVRDNFKRRQPLNYYNLGITYAT